MTQSKIAVGYPGTLLYSQSKNGNGTNCPLPFLFFLTFWNLYDRMIESIEYLHTKCWWCCKGFARHYQWKREWGENPLRLNCRCVHRSFCIRWRKPVIGKLRRQDIKMQIFLNLYGASHKTCFDIIFLLWKDNIFGCFQPDCDASQKNTGCGNFWIKKITAVFFMIC